MQSPPRLCRNHHLQGSRRYAVRTATRHNSCTIHEKLTRHRLVTFFTLETVAVVRKPHFNLSRMENIRIVLFITASPFCSRMPFHGAFAKATSTIQCFHRATSSISAPPLNLVLLQSFPAGEICYLWCLCRLYFVEYVVLVKQLYYPSRRTRQHFDQYSSTFADSAST